MLDQDRPTQSSSFAIGKRIARARSRVNRARVRVRTSTPRTRESPRKSQSHIYLLFLLLFFFFIFSYLLSPFRQAADYVSSFRFVFCDLPSHLSLPLTLSRLSFSFSHLGITNLLLHQPIHLGQSHASLSRTCFFSFLPHPFAGGDRRRNSQ